MTLHIVTGAGPMGTTVAEQLAAAGENVRILTRSGSGPEHPLVERRRVDLSGNLHDAFAGATAVYHCAHGSKYDAAVWQRELPAMEAGVLAAARGAVVVFPESLYAYVPTDGHMNEATPANASGGKRGIRTALLAARAASPTPTVSVMASDFFGPHVLTAHMGDRAIPNIFSGNTIRVMGSADAPHSFTYVPDFAAAMIRAAASPSLWNTVLNAPTGPAVTQRQMLDAYAGAAGVATPKIGVLAPWLVKTMGTVVPSVRELGEMMYQFQKPFVLDSTRSEHLLGLAPTPLAQAAQETIDWWKASHGQGLVSVK